LKLKRCGGVAFIAIGGRNGAIGTPQKDALATRSVEKRA
jgi:hypothetical protein